MVEQIFNSRVIIEKHLQHQGNLHHNFMTSRRRLTESGMQACGRFLRSFNIEEELVLQQLLEFFKTTVSVRQGCLLSPILFNLFLEKIMQETFHDHHTSIFIAGSSISNLQFADDINLTGRQQW